MSQAPFAAAPRWQYGVGLTVDLVCLVAVWLLLTRGDARGLLFGIGVAAVATGVRRRLLRAPAFVVRPAALARFLPYFLWQSLQGGVDIAWRALSPGGPGSDWRTGWSSPAIEPRLHHYELRIPPGNARTFFVGVVSLLPGTLSADLDGDRLEVHVIGGSRDVHAQLDQLERLVAPLFALDVTGRSEDG